MKRAYSPKEIAAKKWVTLPWDEKWSKPFGFPAENASWFISGASADSFAECASCGSGSYQSHYR